MSNGSMILTFLLGAAAGSFVTWKLLKHRYEQIAQEEIDSVKEVYSQRFEKDIDEVEAPKVNSDYDNLLKKEGYIDYSDVKKEEKEVAKKKPYVIPPEEFGENDYETISLTYYEDGVLTDDANYPIDDVESIVGEDSLNHFGEYEDDSVFVRNDEMKIDYEILRSARTYAEGK